MDIQKINHLQVEYVAIVRVRDSLNVKLLEILKRIEDEEKRTS